MPNSLFLLMAKSFQPLLRRAKRALKLDTVKKDNPPDATPLKSKKKSLNSYSPTTGTCQISPFSSPTSHHAQTLGNRPSNGASTEQTGSESGLSRRGQPQTEEDESSTLSLHNLKCFSHYPSLSLRAHLTSQCNANLHCLHTPCWAASLPFSCVPAPDKKLYCQFLLLLHLVSLEEASPCSWNCSPK
ncbi:centromere protein R isoform X2 [Apus apus]|uniref:centromere protein R isoform X2 n=1 Tax=Apus apus TaxID=8895 RepID=UPI0021F837C7|nr:centromere protein R isoform X2 [Apus apus]